LIDGGDNVVKLREALKAISNQLLEDFSNAPIGSRWTSILIPEWQISKSNDEIIISGDWGDNPLPNSPSWLNFNLDENDKFLIAIPSSVFMYECIGLIYEVWRTRQESDQSLQYLLSESLQSLRRRWQQMGDPLGEEIQMRLVGEIIPLVESIRIIGRDALDAWDSEGRALYDIEAENWIIEAKATRTEPERVWLSHPTQVDWRSHKPIILAVTRMNKDSNLGVTFPNIIEEWVSTLTDELQNEVRLLLLTIGFAPELNSRYLTKWVIHGTRYLPITQDSPVIDCEIFDGKPNEVIEIKYQLETQTMPSIELNDFLG
jgi:hypothetical protein